MFLSKIQIPWHLAKQPYQLHQSLWTVFLRQPEAKRDFLFRVERLTWREGAAVLMQSIKQPVSSNSVRVLAVKEWPLKLQAGQRLRFRLRANPVKAIKDVSKGTVIRNKKEYVRTTRVPLIKEDEQQAWLERKFAQCAQVESLIIQQEPPLNFRKAEEQRSGKIQPVLFDGIVTIVQPDSFSELVCKGVGPAKAFGCGMVSLAAASY